MIVVLATAASCGRVSFEPLRDAARDTGDVGADAQLPLAQAAYVKAASPGMYAEFGSCVGLSSDGTWLVVGAELEGSSATGINGDQANNAAFGSGAGYVFLRSGSALIQQAYLKASNTGTNALFGGSIAVSADGSTVAIGSLAEASASTGINSNQADISAPNTGAVYVFARTGTTWIQEAYVKASNAEFLDTFGTSVALSADGATLVVGAVNESSSSTGVGGNQADNSASRSGAVYVFTRTGTAWAQTAYLKASNTGALDQFGSAVALAADGATLAVAAYAEDSASTGINGTQTDDSAPNAGAAYVFTRSGTTWAQAAYLKASNTDADDVFGTSIALSADGTTLAVGAPGEDSGATGINGDQHDGSASAAGAVYVYTRTGTSWIQQAYVKASNAGVDDRFGSSVALSATGTMLAVGASGEASAATGVGGDQLDHSTSTAGAAYVFAGPAWTQATQTAYVKASNTGMSDWFGLSLALASQSETLAVGAPGEDSGASGIGGNQSDDSVGDSGAVYLFR